MTGTTTRAVSIAARIKVARSASPILHLEAYCQGSECPAREVTLHLKDYDRIMAVLVRARGLTCPVCGGPLVLHWVRTAAQQQEADDRAARCSVNVQMYVRDHCKAEALACFPASVAVRDELPPTPSGWFGSPPSAVQPQIDERLLEAVSSEARRG